MKAAPEKIYINQDIEKRLWLIGKGDSSHIEYTQTDAFIEKAKKWFEKQNEWFDPNGNRHCNMESFEDFVNYMRR